MISAFEMRNAVEAKKRFSSMRAMQAGSVLLHALTGYDPKKNGEVLALSLVNDSSFELDYCINRLTKIRISHS
jgi:hypothetical protein